MPSQKIMYFYNGNLESKIKVIMYMENFHTGQHEDKIVQNNKQGLTDP